MPVSEMERRAGQHARTGMPDPISASEEGRHHADVIRRTASLQGDAGTEAAMAEDGRVPAGRGGSQVGRLIKLRRLSKPGRRNGADEDLAAALYRDFHEPLLGLVIKLTAGDRQWAEDIVQETLLRAWRSADQLYGDESLMPWLATVARRLVIDDWRRRRSRPMEVNDDPLEEMPDTDKWEQLLQSITVNEALRSLSPVHREVLVETFLRDRSVNEAAKVLGVPVGTVKSRCFYALRALRVALGEKGLAP
jgi:RNA polymerase sigma-70 factor (ECF subfamily)